MEFNSQRSGLEKKFYEVCEKVVSEAGLEVYDLNYVTGNTTLKLFIRDPKTDTAVIEDCMKIDRALTPYFEEDWVPDDLVLEVSSPGMFRDLKTLAHFKQSVGSRVKLKLMGQNDELMKTLKGQKQVTGELKSVNDEKLALDVDGKNLELNFIDIKKANLEPKI